MSEAKSKFVSTPTSTSALSDLYEGYVSASSPRIYEYDDTGVAYKKITSAGPKECTATSGFIPDESHFKNTSLIISHLEYEGGSSSKFYEVAILWKQDSNYSNLPVGTKKGAVIITRYGRMLRSKFGGSIGKALINPPNAMDRFDEIILEKRAKGYKQTDSDIQLNDSMAFNALKNRGYFSKRLSPELAMFLIENAKSHYQSSGNLDKSEQAPVEKEIIRSPLFGSW